MSGDFNDYKVLGIVDSGVNGSCYRVEDVNTGRLFVWEPVDYCLLSNNGKSLLDCEVNKLRELCHPHLVRCYNVVDHHATQTLYLVKEFCTGSVAAFVRNCRSTNSFVDETFLWRILYQSARAAQARYTWGPPSIQLDFTPMGVHLDDNGNVRLDFWFVFRESEAERRVNNENASTNSKNGSEYKRKKLDTWCLGALVYELACLRPPTNAKKQEKLPPHYSEDLQKLILVMLSKEEEKRPTIEGILYHPALVSHVVKGSLQQLKISATSDSTSVSSGSTADNCLRCLDFEKRSMVLRNRESNVRRREQDLISREDELKRKERQVALLERAAREKMTRAEVYLGQIRRPRVATLDRPDNLDSSSYSADPGDTSLPTTAAKLDPSKIVRPASLAPSISSRRSVRFDPIPEFGEPKYNRSCKTWLENKRIKFMTSKAKRSKVLGQSNKENQFPSVSVAADKHKNDSIISLPYSTKENQDGVLETFFNLKL